MVLSRTVAVAPFLAELAGRAEVLAREHGAELERKLEGEGFVEIDSQRASEATQASQRYRYFL